MDKGIGGHTRAFRGRSDDWITPKHILKAFPTFDLDPCCCIQQPWPTAKNKYTIEDNGLNQHWQGSVWLNPPYGPETTKWMEKLKKHNNGIALIFARTETKMFFNHIWPSASGILFIKNRLYFHYPNGEKAKSNSGGPSVLISYGQSMRKILKEASKIIEGKYITLNKKLYQ